MPGVEDQGINCSLSVKNEKKYQFEINIPVKFAKELKLKRGTKLNLRIVDGELITRFIKPEKIVEKLTDDEMEFVKMFLKVPKKAQEIDCKSDNMCSIYNKLIDRDDVDLDDTERRFVEIFGALRSAIKRK